VIALALAINPAIALRRCVEANSARRGRWSAQCSALRKGGGTF